MIINLIFLPLSCCRCQQIDCKNTILIRYLTLFYEENAISLAIATAMFPTCLAR